MRKNILITGGAGFIGGAVARHLIAETSHRVCVLDKLTYAGNLDNLVSIADHTRFSFEQADICDRSAVSRIFASFQPEIVMHLAAESHVDRSIDGPAAFIDTNVSGTFILLEAARTYWQGRTAASRAFRFHHVSTDEVFGSLEGDGLFHEASPYQPNSPYAASKAAADHLVRAWHHTYGLPVVISNCSNNYGPYHFPEKLIPLMILNAFEGKPLPVYGSGDNVRDWLYVDDHARALALIAEQGRVGHSYNVGGASERSNLDVVETICRVIDEIVPDRTIGARKSLIRFVADRPGHDKRYAIDARKLRRELGWAPRETFESGLAKTIRWYIDNPAWWQRIRSGVYRGERLGTVA